MRDLGAVLDHLAPGERAVLAGSSWGAWLAVAFARADAARPGLTRAQLDSLHDELRYDDPAIDTVPVARRSPVSLTLPTRDDVLGAPPNARRATVAGAGHDPWFEQPDAFFAAVRGFPAAR